LRVRRLRVRLVFGSGRRIHRQVSSASSLRAERQTGVARVWPDDRFSMALKK
jgi:hypothetical protein